MSADAFMAALRARHSSAMREHPEQCWQIPCVFAGRAARLRVVGRALAGVLDGAFGHLRTESTAPALSIDLWDESVTGTGADAEAPDGATFLAGNGVLTSAYGGRIVGHQLAHTTMWLDRASGCILGSVTAAGDLSLYERGKPLHYLLALWHNDSGTFVTHGALVARGDRGVLLAGVGGSGKSTTVAACLLDGFTLVGDDCVALERSSSGRFTGHSLFASPWLDEGALDILPSLALHARHGQRPGETKALIELPPELKERLAASADVMAVALPRIAMLDAPRVRPASKGEAMRALAPSSILLFAPSPGRAGLRQLAALVESVPAFWIDLPADPRRAPAAIDAVLDAAAVPPGGVTYPVI